MSDKVGTAVRLCSVSDLVQGQMKSFQVGGRDVIVLWPDGGSPKAYDGLCPHQGLPLGDGDFDGSVLVCIAHNWSFDAATGECVSPGDCALTTYPLRLAGDDVMIEIAG